MADSSTTRYALVLPEVGASADSWGSKVNANFSDTDALLGAITTTGSADAYVLTTGLSLAAYVTGQTFIIKSNFANTGAATINVDSLGAKSIVKNGATALASGDIASGGIYVLSYDGTNFQLIGFVGQPLDATLTALAALSWSSGSALVQFTAADTVSLTLNPSVTTLTTASTSASTAGVTAKNVTDNATVEALRIEGDRATPAANDRVYAGFYLSDSAGNQTEMARIIGYAATVTDASEDGRLEFATLSGGSMTTRLQLNNASFRPITNDAVALGAATLSFSDLFLASGGVINWNNGDVTVTHSTNALAFAGASSGYSFDATVTASQGAAATTASGTFVNTTDSATVMALRIEGDRATPTNGDIVYASFYLSDSAGNQEEFGRIACVCSTVTNASEASYLLFYARAGGTLATATRMTTTAFSPHTSDGMSLGTASLFWSDLFLASGAVINFNNGDVTITHSTDTLTIAGGGLVAPIKASTETTGTLTSASANRVVACSGGVTLPASVFAAQDMIVFDPGTSSRTFTRGAGLAMYVNGTDSASATLAANQMGGAYYRDATTVVLSGGFS